MATMRNSITASVLLIILAALTAAYFAASVERKKSMNQKAPLKSGAEIVQLPRPRYESNNSVEQALLERRSIRQYRNEPLSLDDLGQLLWAAQGITYKGIYRTAPSAGALYPLETYAIAGNVANLPAGIYRYIPLVHKLTLIRSGDIRQKLSNACLSQTSILKAPASLVFCAVFARTTGKYGTRGIRYVHMEVGSVAQNVSLQAVSLNLGTVAIGAFDDKAVHSELSLPPEEEPILVMPVGKN